MKKFLLIAALAFAATAFVACSDENTGWGEGKKPVIEEKGYLNIADGGLSVIFEQELGPAELDPEQSSKTRADEGATEGGATEGGSTGENNGSSENENTANDKVDVGEFWIEVLTEQGEPVMVEGTDTPIKFQYKDWTGDKTNVPGYVVETEDNTAENYNEYIAGLKGIKLPVGTYVIRAWSVKDGGEIPELSFNAEYEGYSEPFTIKRGVEISQEDAVTVECTLAYVRVSVQFDEILASLIDPAETQVKVALGNGDDVIEHTYNAPTNDSEAEYTYNEEGNKDANDLTKTSYFVYMLPKKNQENPLNIYLTTVYNGSEINNQLLPVENVKAGEYRKITIKLQHGDEGQVYFVVEVKKVVYNQEVIVSVNNYLVLDDEGNGGTLTESGIPNIMFESPKYDVGSMVSIEDEMFDSEDKFKGPLMKLVSEDPIDALYVTATSTNSKITEKFKALGLIVEDTTSGDESEGTTSSKPAIAGVNLLLDVATDTTAGLSQAVKEGLDELGIPNGAEAFKNLTVSGVEFSMAGLMELIHHGKNGDSYNGTYSFTFTPVVKGKAVTPITVTVFLNAIVIDWPGKDMDKVYKVTPDLKVKINIFAKNGIKNLNVTIKGRLAKDPQELISLGLDTNFDLANPSTGAMSDALSGLGFPVGNEVKGQTEIIFDITKFMGMLGSFPGESNFGIEVVDTEGNKLQRWVNILVE